MEAGAAGGGAIQQVIKMPTIVNVVDEHDTGADGTGLSEEEMRDMVRAVMTEPGLGGPSKDVATIKGQVQQLRYEFASIRADFMSMLRKTPRPSSRVATEQPPSPRVDARPEHALVFSTPLPRELLFGKAVPAFSVAFADARATGGLPAVKLVATLCQADSDADVAQILFGENEVILRGGAVEFSGLQLGRLSWMKKSGVFRLKISSSDSTCPYRLQTLFTPPIDVRTKPSSKSNSQRGLPPPLNMALSAGGSHSAPQSTPGSWASPLASPQPLTSPQPPTPTCQQPQHPSPQRLSAPAQAVAMMKRKPDSNALIEKVSSPLPLRPAPAPGLDGTHAGTASPSMWGGDSPSWMELLRPSFKKNRPKAEVDNLAGDLDRVSMGQGMGQGHDPLQPQAQGIWGGAPSGSAPSGGAGPGRAPRNSQEAAPGLSEAPGLQSPPFLGEREHEKSGSNLSALQRLNSSGLMDLALSVFGHDGMDEALRTNGFGDLPVSPVKATNSALGKSPLLPRQR